MISAKVGVSLSQEELPLLHPDVGCCSLPRSSSAEWEAAWREAEAEWAGKASLHSDLFPVSMGRTVRVRAHVERTECCAGRQSLSLNLLSQGAICLLRCKEQGKGSSGTQRWAQDLCLHPEFPFLLWGNL